MQVLCCHHYIKPVCNHASYIPNLRQWRNILAMTPKRQLFYNLRFERIIYKGLMNLLVLTNTEMYTYNPIQCPKLHIAAGSSLYCTVLNFSCWSEMTLLALNYILVLLRHNIWVGYTSCCCHMIWRRPGKFPSSWTGLIWESFEVMRHQNKS